MKSIRGSVEEWRGRDPSELGKEGQTEEQSYDEGCGRPAVRMPSVAGRDEDEGFKDVTREHFWNQRMTVPGSMPPQY